MTSIAVDAMGGDHAPRAEVEGAIAAARELGVRVILVGKEDGIRRELSRHPHQGLPLDVVHANEVITMDDHAVKAVRSKRDSSIIVAARMVRDGKAQGVVSAGNPGAAMVTLKRVWGALPGGDRPALAGIFPTSRGTMAIMVDVGANVDCKPENLEQFAVMGEIYSRAIFSILRPRVGLLSIGEEQHKGNELTREAYGLLQKLPLDFLGNVEGRDLYNGKADVIICDGFIGNVALKISEGLVETIKYMLKEALSSTLSAKVGYVLSRQAFADFKKRLDYSEFGGAPLLGVKGCAIVCHGSSNANAIKNAVRVAAEYAGRHINERIAAELSQAGHADGKAKAIAKAVSSDSAKESPQ